MIAGRLTLIALVIMVLNVSVAAAVDRSHVPAEGAGSVHMPISCASVQADFDRALALLHSFWYDRALAIFDDVIKRDPNCGIAYWGAAMTFNHPLWGPPSADDLTKGNAYLKRSASASERSDRETRLLAAARILFGDGDPKSKQQRDEAYLKTMAELYAAYADDETALFYALAIEGTYRYGHDAERTELAGKLVEMVHAHQPAHPGALHYTIHAYDYPGYEERGLSAARAYAASAPAIPHALHMPSHTFLALGLWQESNDTNRNAWAASDAAIRAAREPLYKRDFHTLWFLVYGDLQAGAYDEALRYSKIAFQQYAEAVPAYQRVISKDDSPYEMENMLMPVVSYGMETGDYGAVPSALDLSGVSPVVHAAALQLLALRTFDAHDAAKAAAARDAVSAFVASARSNADTSPYRKGLLAVIASETTGLYQLRVANDTAGFASLQAAVEAEDALPFLQQPFATLPAHEIYGRELLRFRRYAEAEREFKKALEQMPNRPMALFGLARAAALLGDRQTAATAQARFDALWKDADPRARAIANLAIKP